MHHPHAVPPALIHLHQRPVDLGREVAQQHIGSGMYAEGGRNQKHQRRLVGEFASGEVALTREFAALLVPAHARPVVEPLQRKVDVLVGFKFKNGEAAVESTGQHVEHGAVGGGERRHLRVDKSRIQPLVDGAHVARDEGFEPALGSKPEEHVGV